MTENMVVSAEQDAITEEVLRMAIRQVSLEMSSVVKRISGSPIITEADDLTAMVYSARGELLDAAFGPAYAGPGGQCMRLLIKRYETEPLVEGDMILANDPFTSGATHANDMQIVTPVFVDGTLVAYVYMHAHVTDVGGIVPGGFAVGARDCFAEALRLPFVKYMSAGVLNSTVRDVIATNTRLPDLALNDIHGMAVATRGAAAQIAKLVSDLGIDTFRRLIAAMLDRTERAARKRVEKLRSGTYHAIDWIEHNGHRDDLYGLRAQMTVEDGTLRFAFTGDPQTDGFINGTPSSLAGKVIASSMGMLFWDIPLNEGIMRVLSVEAVPRTVACAEAPAPISSTHLEAGFKVLTLCANMIGEAMEGCSDPEMVRRAHAPFAASITMATFAGQDSRKGYVVFADMGGLASGVGGSPELDGLDVGCTQPAAVIKMADIESMEDAFPILYLWRGLRADSGGPGEHRGGTGLDLAWICHGTDKLTGTLNSASGHLPAPGAKGGYPGSTTDCEIIDGVDVAADWFAKGMVPAKDSLPDGNRLPIKISGITVSGKKVWRMRMPGGGGWGDPIARDPAAVVRDIRIGAVSPGQAAQTYGVIANDDGVVDEAATAGRRADIRADRRANVAAANDPIDNTAVGHTAHCRACDAAFDVAALRNSSRRMSPLAGRMAAFGVMIDPLEGLLLNEVICEDCGAMLDVRHSGVQAVPELAGELRRVI